MLTASESIKISKLLSLVLRHKPQAIGITLDENGWTDVQTLLTRLAANGHQLTPDQLYDLVDTNPKKRFALTDDRTRIRANQGHSVEIDLGYRQSTPPEWLFHGTATRFIDSIMDQGLKKMGRHHVHLSDNEATARQVGSRHGKPVVLVVQAEAMARAGFVFFQSENGVWLTNHIPAAYLSSNGNFQAE